MSFTFPPCVEAILDQYPDADPDGLVEIAMWHNRKECRCFKGESTDERG